MAERDLREWAPEGEEKMSTTAKVVSVGLLVIIGLVALSLIPDEVDSSWQIIYGVVGLGAIVFGVKAARE